MLHHLRSFGIIDGGSRAKDATVVAEQRQNLNPQAAAESADSSSTSAPAASNAGGGGSSCRKAPQVKSKKRRGRGTFYYPCGDAYEGEFEGDLKHGFGVFLYHCGDAYAGEWRNNQRHGFGMFMKSNGLKYEGTWKYDVRSGCGLQSLAHSFRYVGHFESNMRHGRGVIFQPNGMLYSGICELGETRVKQLLFQQHYSTNADTENIVSSSKESPPLTQEATAKVESTSGNTAKKFILNSSETGTVRKYDTFRDSSKFNGSGTGADLASQSLSKHQPCFSDNRNESETYGDSTGGTAAECDESEDVGKFSSARSQDREDLEKTKSELRRKSVSAPDLVLNRKLSENKSRPLASGNSENSHSSSSDESSSDDDDDDDDHVPCILRNLKDESRGDTLEQRDVLSNEANETKRSNTEGNKAGGNHKEFERRFKRVQYASNAENCLEWTVEEVAHFVTMLGFRRYAQCFVDHSIDGSVLLQLIQNIEANLSEIGVDDFAVRKCLTLAFELLLKLQYRCAHRSRFSYDKLKVDDQLRNFEVSPSRLYLSERTGEGGYGCVYKAQYIFSNGNRNNTSSGSSAAAVSPGDLPIPDAAAAARKNVKATTDVAVTGRTDGIAANRRRLFPSLTGSLTSSSSSGSSSESESTQQTTNRVAAADVGQMRGGGGRQRSALSAGSAAVTVAVKMFRPAGNGRDLHANQVATVRDFYSELSVMARLRHPNITLFLGVVTKPMYCIVTEFVPCGSLFDLLHRHRLPLSLSQVVRVVREICCGMAYLHSNGVLHCDLKSSNILLSETGHVKICDFGLATLTSDGKVSSRSGPCSPHSQFAHNRVNTTDTPQMLGCVGTHHWMAPEVLRGEGFTKAADVYSFGMILWEILARKVPYHEMPLVHIIASVGYGGRRPGAPLPKSLWGGVSNGERGGSTDSLATTNTSATSHRPVAAGLHSVGRSLATLTDDVPEAILSILQACLQPVPGSRPPFEILAARLDGIYQSAIIEVEESLRDFFGQE